MKTFLYFFLVPVLVGCASVPSSQVMVNPDTGRSVMVSHHSWGYGMRGIAAAIGAQEAQKSDIASLKNAGFVEIEKVATSGFTFAHENPLEPPVVGIVHPNGPAFNAGIKTGDIILERNGQPVKTLGELKSQPRPTAGQTTEWKMLRDKKVLTFSTVAIPASQLLSQNSPGK